MSAKLPVDRRSFLKSAAVTGTAAFVSSTGAMTAQQTAAPHRTP